MPEKVRFRIEQVLPWGFLGVVVTIAIGVASLYPSLRQKSPGVSFEISDYNVLDIHRPLKDLSISFRGHDIQQSGQNLRIYTITVRNDGDVDIRQTDFDQNKPWGLSLVSAQIIDQPRLVYANSDYLRENLSPRTISDSQVEFNKIIFEKGKLFTIEIQVLHRITIEPTLVPIGKIAGIEAMTVLRKNLDERKTSFWQQAFNGTPGVQIIRVLAYFLGFILVIVLSILLAFLISEARDRTRRTDFEKGMEAYLEPLASVKGSKGRQLVKSVFAHFRGNVDSIQLFLQSLQAAKRESDGTLSPNVVSDLTRSRQGTLALPSSITDLLFVEANEIGKVKMEPRAISTIEELIRFMNENPLPSSLAQFAKNQAVDEIMQLDAQSRAIQEKLNMARLESRTRHGK